MVGNAGASEGVCQPSYERLSPAEAHNILRQKLIQLAPTLGFSAADTHQLVRKTQILTYAPGEVILPRGVRAECLGLVVRGQVAVQRSQRGGDRPMAVLVPGNTFGEQMLTSGRSTKSTLEALTRCEIWFLRRADLSVLVRKPEARKQRRSFRGAIGLVSLVLLVAMLFLFVPASRQPLALLPMSVGQLCYQQGNEQCAESSWLVAASVAPVDASPQLALGMLYLEQGQIGLAEHSLLAASELAPEVPEVLNNLGLVYAHQGDHERAIEAFSQALELEPGIQAIENNLGYSLQALSEYDQALDHYQLALSLGQPQASTWANMAIAYYETARTSQATEAAQQALHYDETLVPAHTILGAVALQAGQPQESLSYLQRAVGLDAGYGSAHFFLGLAYKAMGKPEEAVPAFEKALAAAKDESTRIRVRRYLAEIARDW